MADLFTSSSDAPAEPASAPTPTRARLHHETDLYGAVVQLNLWIARATSNFRRDIKPTYGVLLVEEGARMAVLVREAAIARDAAKLPYLEEILRQLELIQFALRLLNELGVEWLPHKTYSPSVGLTASIGRQAHGLISHFRKHFASAAS